MAGDGFVRMPEEPERWVRLIDGGYQIRIPYDGMARYDIIRLLEAGRQFHSAAKFVDVLGRLCTKCESIGILEVVRPNRFTSIGKEIVRIVRQSTPASEQELKEHLEGIIDAALRAEYRKDRERFSRSGKLSESESIELLHRDFLLRQHRTQQLDLEFKSLYQESYLGFRIPSLFYLIGDFWHELGRALLLNATDWSCRFVDAGAPFPHYAPVGSVGVLCQLTADRISSGGPFGEMPLGLEGERMLELVQNEFDGDLDLREMISMYRNGGARYANPLAEYLRQVLAKGPRKFDAQREYPNVITFDVIGELPRGVAERIGVNGGDDANAAAARIEGDVVDAIATPKAIVDLTGLVRDDGSIDMKKRGEFAASFDGVKMRIELARVLALAIIDNKKCKWIRGPTVYEWVGFTRQSMRSRTNPRRDGSIHPSRMDEEKRGDKSERGVVFYTRASVLRHLAAKYGALNEGELRSARAWKDGTIKTE